MPIDTASDNKVELAKPPQQEAPKQRVFERFSAARGDIGRKAEALIQSFKQLHQQGIEMGIALTPEQMTLGNLSDQLQELNSQTEQALGESDVPRDAVKDIGEADSKDTEKGNLAIAPPVISTEVTSSAIETTEDQEEKKKAQEQRGLVQKTMRKLRTQFGLAEKSLLIPPEIDSEEKQRVTNEYVERKLQKKLADGEGYSDRINIEHEVSGKFDKIQRAAMLTALRAKGIENAGKYIDVFKEFGYTDQGIDLKTALNKNTIQFLQKYTPDDIRRGLDTIAKLGYRFQQGQLTSEAFIQAFDVFARSDDTAISNIKSQLNPYYFLGRNEWNIFEVGQDGTKNLSSEFLAIMQIVENGGLTEDQKKKLDANLKLSLLDSEVVLTKDKEGKLIGHYPSNETNLGDVLANAPSVASCLPVISVAEDIVFSRINGDLPKHEEPPYRGDEDCCNSIYQLFKLQDKMPLEDLKNAMNKGFRRDINDLLEGYSLNLDKSLPLLQNASMLAQDAYKLEMAAFFAELTYQADQPVLSLKNVERYEDKIKRLELETVFLDSLPLDGEQLFAGKDGGFFLDGRGIYTGGPVVDADQLFNAIERTLRKARWGEQDISLDNIKLMQISYTFLNRAEESWNRDKRFDIAFNSALPLFAFLATHKDDINNYFTDEMKPTEKLAKLVIVDDILHDDSARGAFLRQYAFDINPRYIIPHLSTLKSKGDFAIIHFAEMLPDEVFVDTEFDPKTLKLLERIKRAESPVLQNVIAIYAGDIDDLYQDNKPTALLIENLAKERDMNTVVKLLTDDLLSTFPQAEQYFWRKWRDEIPAELREIFVNRKGEFRLEEPGDQKKFTTLIQLLPEIIHSPSKEIKHLESELVVLLSQSEDPVQIFRQIQSVFEKNNLPPFGKAYRVFEILYCSPDKDGKARLESNLESLPYLSPVLKKAATQQERREIIYKDLLMVNIESGNPQLAEYLRTFQEGESMVDKFQETGEIASLSDTEQSRLTHFLDRMDTLYINSLFGRTIEERKRIIEQRKQRRLSRNPSSYKSPNTHDLPVGDRIAALKKNFRVHPDQSFSSRLTEMFVRPAGFQTIDEVLKEINTVKQKAGERNRKFAGNGTITVAANDRFKGVDAHNLSKLLESGIVAREFLGSGSNSDGTPFDTDTSLVLPSDTENGVKGAIDNSLSKGYGDILFLIRDRGQFNPENPHSYESFSSSAAGNGQRHFGIRTGIASTEIDAIVLKDQSIVEKKLDDMYLAIAKNGMYIPVVDTNGNVLFTPELYEQYKHAFDGVEKYHGNSLETQRLSQQEQASELIRPEVRQMLYDLMIETVKSVKQDEEKVDELSEKVRNIIHSVLSQHEINLRKEFDISIYGAELMDTGSSGRHTNVPGDHDFDLALLLDVRDASKREAVAAALKTAFNLTKDDSHSETDYIQLRAIGATAVDVNPIDIDVGIGNRSDLSIFPSSDAVSQKLDSIREKNGEDAYYEVLAQIVMAKQMLKEAHAYKKGVNGDGGFGGIGTENWILAHNGNLISACTSFYNIAHEKGVVIPLEEFKKKYKVFDAGTNVKYPDQYENFINHLSDSGYHAMLTGIEQYLQLTPKSA